MSTVRTSWTTPVSPITSTAIKKLPHLALSPSGERKIVEHVILLLDLDEQGPRLHNERPEDYIQDSYEGSCVKHLDTSNPGSITPSSARNSCSAISWSLCGIVEYSVFGVASHYFRGASDHGHWLNREYLLQEPARDQLHQCHIENLSQAQDHTRFSQNCRCALSYRRCYSASCTTAGGASKDRLWCSSTSSYSTSTESASLWRRRTRGH